MYTKEDFQNAISSRIDNFPAVASLFHSGDPRIRQHLDAMAAMLSLLSAQIETAMTEPFEKTRDATILADAAMRGIVPKSTPARARIRARNKGLFDVQIDISRIFLDSSGNSWKATTSALVPKAVNGIPGEAAFDAEQVKTLLTEHVVDSSIPFYSIPVKVSEEGLFLSGISVSDGDGNYEYRERYVNTFPDERVFHVESDDRQQVYVRFGYKEVVATQPDEGSVIRLSIDYSLGEYAPDYGSPFSFEYINTPNEPNIELLMDALVKPGQNPVSMTVLRDLARYPSVYEHNAVFLGEFDFLVRRKFTSLKFLSVWNEVTEEIIRGPSLDNINALFVACFGANEDFKLADGSIPAPSEIDENALTETQKAIRDAILAADDSYRIRFFTPVKVEIFVTIRALISTSFVASDVRQKIIDTLLAEFGEESAAAKRGGNRVLYQRVYAILRSKIPALQSGEADLIVTIQELDSPQAPEMWRYVSLDSLSVSVENKIPIVNPSWR